ncbi:MAG TPA: GDSL-type esterase/lipase family protein [Candidatus Bathyarchaeia archaeon]
MTTTRKKLLAAGTVTFISLVGILALFFGSLIDTVQASPVRVACVGDSITQGAYPKNLQSILGTDFRVGNFGVSGSTVLLNSDRPYMNQSAFLKTKSFQPSIVVIMLGTNDAHEDTYASVDNFLGDFKKLINEYQNLESDPEIWLVKPPPIFENNMKLNNTNLEQGIIPRIELLADELNLPLVDINGVLLDYPEYFGDGVHPNFDGARLIAKEIGQAVFLDET